jgi:shikimate dehydrogenase
VSSNLKPDTPDQYGVVGHPIAHSWSPFIHGMFAKATAQNLVYRLFDVAPDNFRREALRLFAGGVRGLNVTVPHKQAALALADTVATAGAAAANTLVRADGGRVVAHNTDVPALAEELRLLAGPGAAWASRRALVLGSGGAAMAAVAALRSLGSTDIVLRARTPRGDATQPWQSSPASEAQTLAVVQATSAGMTGADPGDTLAGVVAWEALPADAVALDVVYAPPETPFLVAARSRGLRHANGLGMLARQGALAFELWLGVPAPLAVMRAALGT